jgi:hypothetical protein
MRDAILHKAVIVDQTSVWSNALPRRDPEEQCRMFHLTARSGLNSALARVLIPPDGAQ